MRIQKSKYLAIDQDILNMIQHRNKSADNGNDFKKILDSNQSKVSL